MTLASNTIRMLIIRRSKNITNLKYDDVTPSNIRDLNRVIKARSHSITSIQLKFSNIYFIHKDMLIFCDCLQLCFYNLQKLKLDFSQAQITDAVLLLLTKVLKKKFLRLSQVDMNLASSDIKYRKIVCLIKGLCINLPNLKSLKLNIDHCGILTKKSIEAIANALKSGSTKLNELEVQFNQNYSIYQDVLGILSQALSTYGSNLKSLYLKMPITDHSMMTFKEALNVGIPSLERLELVSACFPPLGDQGINYLSEALGDHRRSKKLLDLHLTFQGFYSITDIGIITLLTDIGTKLYNLRYLSLDFITTCLITDETLRSISQEISKGNMDLSTLQLRFNSCKKITDEGTSTLSKSLLDRPSNIKRLELIFSNCDKISDATSFYIGVAIGQGLKSLRHLKLELSFCGYGKEITDFSIITLTRSFRVKNTTLSSLDLDFSGSSKLTNAAVMALCETIYSERFNLIGINLRFDECKKITNIGRASIKKLL